VIWYLSIEHLRNSVSIFTLTVTSEVVVVDSGASVDQNEGRIVCLATQVGSTLASYREPQRT
jgi:hypothetical protein